MSLQSVLVHVDNSRSTPARIDSALRLADRHGAHLTAIYCEMPMQIPEHIRAMIPDSVRQMQAKRVADEIAQARAAFDATCRTVGFGARAEWRHAIGAPLDQIALHARYADIAVVGQTDPDLSRDGDIADFPGTLALAAGRPILAIPYVGKYPTIGENVLIAWNASREATRAVNDALPILEKARQVTVLTVNPHGGPDGHGDVPGADIALHLARHNVKVAATQIVSDDLDPGDVILSRAADLSVDLLVMGAYGRSRLREMILGGVSRQMMQHMTLPVLLSH